ncbi:MAG: tetratricopeptide repeat protein [Bacteroidales bacterium]|nr:tetratricopeptide repeat protein [Bacteroidales bacterium]
MYNKINMKKSTILISLLIINSILFELSAQKSVVDSMENLLLQHIKEDTATVNLLNRTANNLYSSDNEKYLIYAKEAEKLADKIEYTNGKAVSLNLIGIYYYNRGNYSIALEYFHKSMELKEDSDDKIGIAVSLNNIGAIHTESENFDEALEYFKKSLEIIEEIGDENRIPTSYNNLGEVYTKLGNFSKALEYYEESLIGRKKLGDKQRISESYQNIGFLYQLQGSYQQALAYHQKSLKIRVELNNKHGIGLSYLNLGNVYLETKNYNKALDYTQRSLKIATELKLINMQKDLYLSLSKIYEGKHIYLKAYENHIIYKELNDSVFNQENTKKITALTHQYKYKKEKQAILLKKQENQKEEERAKQQQYILFVIFILILIIIGTSLRFRLSKIRAEKKYLLKEIQILKSEAIIYMGSFNDFKLNDNLNRKKIEAEINGVLNDSDWSVLTILCEKPTIKNREISEQVSLSIDGVRSSLRKMYRNFNIKNTKENQRTALVIKAFQISKKA